MNNPDSDWLSTLNAELSNLLAIDRFLIDVFWKRQNFLPLFHLFWKFARLVSFFSPEKFFSLKKLFDEKNANFLLKCALELLFLLKPSADLHLFSIAIQGTHVFATATNTAATATLCKSFARTVWMGHLLPDQTQFSVCPPLWLSPPVRLQAQLANVEQIPMLWINFSSFVSPFFRSINRLIRMLSFWFPLSFDQTVVVFSF